MSFAVRELPRAREDKQAVGDSIVVQSPDV